MRSLIQTDAALSSSIKSALRDMQLEIVTMFAEGDRVALHYIFRAHHAGEYMGMPPAGKQISACATTIFRISNGQ